MAPSSLNFMSSTVSAFVTGRRIAVCGTLMSEQKRMASGLWSLGAITGFVHQVVGCLLGTVLMTPCSFNSVPHVQLFGLNCKGFVWILSSTINFALMCLCFPRSENTSRYSDINVDTTGSVWMRATISLSSMKAAGTWQPFTDWV